MTDWPDSQNNEPDQVEPEWKLLQVNSAAKDELQGGADDMGDGSETVTRRYEFYRYAAAADTLDGHNNEAMCSEVNPTTNPRVTLTAKPAKKHASWDGRVLLRASSDAPDTLRSGSVSRQRTL